MGIVVREHTFSDGAPARPEQVNENESILYAEINGNLDWNNIKPALQNAANGFVKLDSDAKVPTAQLPTGIPSGVITMWAGTLLNIPAGWSLCDGTGGTPDLRERFIVGTPNGVNPGDTGGSDSITLVVNNLPSHTHGIGTLAAGIGGAAHTHGIGTLTIDSSGLHTHAKGTLGTNSTGSHTHTYNNWTTIVTAGDYIHAAASHLDYAARTTGSSGSHSHVISGSTASDGTHIHILTGATASGGSAHIHTLTGLTAAIGSDAAFDNRPAYYKLAFIQKD